jgi:hypothetical protein
VTVQTKRTAGDHTAIVTPRSNGVRNAVAFAVCVLATGAFLFSGLVVLLFLFLTPYLGLESPLLVAKAGLVVGWLVLGVWLAFEVVQLRFRAVIPAALAWGWAVLFWTTITGIGFIQYGG